MTRPSLLLTVAGRAYLEALRDGRDPFAGCRDPHDVAGLVRTKNVLVRRRLVDVEGGLTANGREALRGPPPAPATGPRLSRVITGAFEPRVDIGMVARLRHLADAVECGTVEQIAIAYLEDDEYSVEASCSPKDGIVLATLAQQAAIKRLYEGPQ